MDIAFCIVLGSLLYVFFIFPSAMMLIGFLPRRGQAAGYTPTVDVLVAARNERACIAAKIRNTFAGTYPGDRLRLLIGSDGSTDGTDDIVRAAQDPRVHLVSLPAGTGKTSVINRLARDATAEILVLSDADVRIEADALVKLIAPFQDPRVGAVCGRRADRARDPGHVGRQARLYNVYEGAIKRGEGRIGRVLGGNGSLYALRRDLFADLPPHAPDDFVAILQVLKKGRRVVYEEQAVSREELPHSARREFVRRRRTTARGVRGLWAARGLLNPLRYPLLAGLLVSHKLLRWGAGLLMVALLLLNLRLRSTPPYGLWLSAQGLFYGAALLGGLPVRARAWKPFKLVRCFVLMNMAATAGLLDVLRGRDWNSWDAGAER